MSEFKNSDNTLIAAVFRGVLAIAGMLIIVTVFAIDLWQYETPANQDWGPVKWMGLGVGLCLAAVAALFRLWWVPRGIVILSLAGLSVTSTLIAVELVVRLTDYDPREPPKDISRIPIYYRGPTVKTGDYFARREGPARWEGKVLSQFLECLGSSDSTYADEPKVVITYDQHGFRNPEGLVDWEIVVVGDSFVETGYLPYEDLFTTHIQSLTGKRVKNLGVSYTGNLTHIQYLKEYGHASSTETAMLVFFEGNDIRETVREANLIEKVSARVCQIVCVTDYGVGTLPSKRMAN